MYPKRSSQADEDDPRPVRTSDRLRRRPKPYGNGRPFLYYMDTRRGKSGKTKRKTAASHIAKMLGNRPVRKATTNVRADLFLLFYVDMIDYGLCFVTKYIIRNFYEFVIVLRQTFSRKESSYPSHFNLFSCILVLE